MTEPRHDPYFEFVLFCHIQPSDEPRLGEIARQLTEFLKQKHGLLVLFVDTGLADLLGMIQPIRRDLPLEAARDAKVLLKTDLCSRSPNLAKGERLGDRLLDAFAGPSGGTGGRVEDVIHDTRSALVRVLGPNVRVLTALDLVDVFGEMSNVQDLRKYLVGRDGKVYYDTPKFIEAIVRLRMIGSGVPVLRLDRDVLIPPAGKALDVPGLGYAIYTIREAARQHQENTQILATMLSANYQTPDWNAAEVAAWSCGYATRVQPALLVPGEADAKRYIGDEVAAGGWGREMQGHFHLPLAQKFFADVWQWGAPKTAVISGALLYMNDAVVLNVPPFSNFSQNVMWIDDHLRYVLHREMGDFCRRTVVSHGEPLHVFYRDVPVPKYRTAGAFLVYTVQQYLPSLLWGSFMDYWLCPANILKLRLADCTARNPDDEKDWLKGRLEGRPGTLARAVREARAGCLPDEGKLRADLRQDADKRLRLVRECWRGLQHPGEQSIAAAWVEGTLPAALRDKLANPGAEKDGKPIPVIPAQLPATVDGFEHGLKDGFNDILYDTCQYVKWVYEWPRVVSVIRAIPHGEFKSDLEWSPPR